MKKPGPYWRGKQRPAAVWCLSLAIFAPVTIAQVRGAAPSGGDAILTSSGRATLRLDRSDPSDLLREIDDPSLGQRWLLYRNPRCPEGPGRLVALAAASPDRSRGPSSLAQSAAATPSPVIRTGDRVVVEENTPVVEARLEAIALGSAFRGAPLKVRLVLGGKVLEALAIAPGRVALAPQPESQP